MTPTQLRAFASVVRLGSVKAAAAELAVTEAAVSMHVAHLRRELDDQLFERTASGLAFTPGGLRLASRAVEILGLQERTVEEVSRAHDGRRLLRVVTTSLFAEHAAPGLIDLFTGRAADLDVELSVAATNRFRGMLVARTVDLAIGPLSTAETLTHKPFLNYEMVTVAAPGHPLAGQTIGAAQARRQTWMLGPAAADPDGPVARLLDRLGVPGRRQRIFQSDAAAWEETRRDHAVVALALRFAVATDLADGRLVEVHGTDLRTRGTWAATTLPAPGQPPAAAELLRFITTPRATQAMVRGTRVPVGRFRPSVHVTLWSRPSEPGRGR